MICRWSHGLTTNSHYWLRQCCYASPRIKDSVLIESWCCLHFLRKLECIFSLAEKLIRFVLYIFVVGRITVFQTFKETFASLHKNPTAVHSHHLENKRGISFEKTFPDWELTTHCLHENQDTELTDNGCPKLKAAFVYLLGKLRQASKASSPLMI